VGQAGGYPSTELFPLFVEGAAAQGGVVLEAFDALLLQLLVLGGEITGMQSSRPVLNPENIQRIGVLPDTQPALATLKAMQSCRRRNSRVAGVARMSRGPFLWLLHDLS
jgi:hypothetical protein